MAKAPKPTQRSAGKAALAGILGGLVGSLAMKGYIVAARRLHGDHRSPALDQGGPSHQVAELAFRGIARRSLSASERVVGGEAEHLGAHLLFGVVSEVIRQPVRTLLG